MRGVFPETGGAGVACLPVLTIKQPIMYYYKSVISDKETGEVLDVNATLSAAEHADFIIRNIGKQAAKEYFVISQQSVRTTNFGYKGRERVCTVTTVELAEFQNMPKFYHDILSNPDQYDRTQVLGVEYVDFDEKTQKWTVDEVDNPETADFWSVYLHRKEGGVECIADLRTKKEAEELAELLSTLRGWSRQEQKKDGITFEKEPFSYTKFYSGEYKKGDVEVEFTLIHSYDENSDSNSYEVNLADLAEGIDENNEEQMAGIKQEIIEEFTK